MEPQEVSYNDVVNYVSGSILSGPEDDIWDVIFDWLMTTMATVIKDVAYAIADAILIVGGALATVTAQIVTALHPLFTDIQATVNTVGFNVVRIIGSLDKLSVNIISAIGKEARGIIDEVGALVQTVGTTVEGVIRTISTTLIPAINSVITTLGKTISTTTDSILKSIASFYASMVTTTTKGISDVLASISTFYTQLSVQTQANFDYLTTTLPENIRKTMDTWWDDFLLNVFDFSSWVGKLFDAVLAWVTRDVPGSSPWWQGMLKQVGNFLYDLLIWAPMTIASTIGYYTWQADLIPLNAIGEMFYTFSDAFFDAIDKLIDLLGPLSPSMGKDVHSSMAKVGAITLTGLAGMTLASSWLKPLGGAGMGHIAAMIYDMTNYKMITGGMMAALTFCAIRIPLTYYYKDKFRPMLPEARQADELYSRDLIPYAHYSELLGYQGLPDVWHEKYADMAYRPVSLYALSSLATTGVFDEKLFMDNLRDLGLKPELRKLVLTMYQAKATETVKGMMSGVAMTRFKEGYTTSSQFVSELRLLRYSDEEIPMFTAAADLSYATDYLTDMKAAYTDAVRKGAISLDEYRESLGSLGIVPERVESFVLRQRIYLRPKEKATPIAPPTPTYETDAGKIQVDTLRRERRKNIISRDEELAGLLMLGMEGDHATAIANNDDVRLTEKSTEA